jgi:hypothetical protein
MDVEKTEKLFALFGQTIASVVAETKLEIFALRQILAERGTLVQRELDERIVALRNDKLPTLTASTSADMRQRFWKFRDLDGVDEPH